LICSQNLPNHFKSTFVPSLCGSLASTLQQFHVQSMRLSELFKTLLLFLKDSYSRELFRGFVRDMYVRDIKYLLNGLFTK
jgi:hypothetical protein